MNRISLRRAIVPVASVATLALVLGGCGGNNNDGGSSSTGDAVSGSLAIDGSSTVGPLTQAASESFNETNPDVKISVGESGTGGGFEKFCAGETDMNDASRPIEASEAKICKSNGVTYSQLIVANDALTVVVNKENTWATCLTTEQLKKIWEPDSTIDNWNQVDPSFPDEKLVLFGPDTDSGTFDYFTDAINGEEGASRTDYSPSSNDNDTVTGVEGSKGGMGYFGYTYYEQNSDSLNALQIDAGDGCVSPSAETVANNTYTPLSRPLFIYPSINQGKDNPALVPFVEYYADNVDTLDEAAQFIALNDEQKSTLSDELAKYKSAVESS